MVASRNQQHVIARGLASLPNGSMPSYFGANELSQHINRNEIQAAKANNNRVQDGPKPRMKQLTRGQPVDQKDISTRYGWSSATIIKDAKGRYVVEHYCPRKNGTVVDKSFDNIEEAQAHSQKITGELRNFGYSGVGYAPSNLGFAGMGNLDVPLVTFMGMVWIGVGYPGARTAIKQIKKVYKEPIPVVQSTLLTVGLVGLIARQFKVI